MRGHFAKDIVGNKYGLLTVISRAPNKGNAAMWNCICECGKTCVVNGSNLRRGLQRSCGCYRNKVNRERLTTHGKSNTRLFHIWQNMRARCSNPNNDDFKNYGGRGITICEEWKNNFQKFYEWATENGYSENLTIDRKNNNGNYSPENCRWVTRKEQNKNRRDNIYLTFQGQTHTLSEWSDITGISRQTVWDRYKNGKKPEEILSIYNLRKSKGEQYVIK